MDQDHVNATLGLVLFCFFANSEENHYGIEKKCRMQNPPEKYYLSEQARVCMCSDKSFSTV